MKFRIIKNLSNGRYFVNAELATISDDEIQKASKFGFPSMIIKATNGKNVPIRIDQLKNIVAYGFYNQKEADEYSEFLKKQILEIKEKWEKLTDTWSKQEEL